MIPTAQQVAVDLGSSTLQVSDSTVNTSASTEPDGSFTAVLQTSTPASGQPPGDDAGRPLPLTGSELPVGETAVPIPESVEDFVAFYEGDDVTLLTTNATAETAEDAAIPGVAGMAPPTLAEVSTDSQNRRDLRGDGRMGLRTLDGRGSFRRDHGRIPFAQPMSPPDRMVFKGAGQGGEIALTAESLNQAVGQAASADETGQAILDRRNMGLGMPGFMPIDQAGRAAGETMAGLEVPGLKDGAELAARPSAAVQASAVASQLAELPQLRDLAGVAKPAPALATTIAQPVMDEAWGEAFQDRVLWMAKGRIQNAEIRLNPAELGPIRVQVSVEDDAAMLNFTAQHNVTREAIEQALPRLREMLSENGLTLAGSTVTDSDDHQANNDQGSSGPESAADTETGTREIEDAGAVVAQRINSDSLVDTFA